VSARDAKPSRLGLGRGLDALLGDVVGVVAEAAPGAAPRDQLLKLAPSALRPNPEQPREVFDAAALQRLSDSLAVHGVLLPLVARRGEDGGYVLIAGERRWRAAQLAGLAEVPVVVKAQPPTELEQLELALIENLQREDLDPIEAARGYQRLIQRYGYAQEQVASRVGKDRSTIANALRLLKLPERGLEALRSGRITAGHARALVPVEDPALFAELLAVVIAKDLSVRATEALVKERARGGTPPGQKPSRKLPRAFQQLAEQVTRAVGSRVELRPKRDGSGTIVIPWHDREDLDRLAGLLRGQG
jgi:ParB family chromosome partitioning protein